VLQIRCTINALITQEWAIRLQYIHQSDVTVK
jgi:hypothetical protein